MLKANEAIEVHVQGSSSGCVAEGWGDAKMVFSFGVVFSGLPVFLSGTWP